MELEQVLDSIQVAQVGNDALHTSMGLATTYSHILIPLFIKGIGVGGSIVQPGVLLPGGGAQYPGGYVPPVGVPNINGVGTNIPQYPGSGSQVVPVGGGGDPAYRGPGQLYYPGQQVGPYPNGYVHAGDVPAKIVDEDDSFSQSETGIKNGEATASAQGKRHGGNAQTQVSGSYSSGGTFSANAQTSDKDRSAQAQVTGNKDGALSSAQGQGGTAKSQSQVQVNEKTGATSATSQSGGSSHESQSEVRVNNGNQIIAKG